MPAPKPPFVRAMDDDYQAQVAHTFCLTGNIYDYVDNSGRDLTIKKVMATWYDDNIDGDLGGGAKAKQKDAGVQHNGKSQPENAHRRVLQHERRPGVPEPEVEADVDRRARSGVRHGGDGGVGRARGTNRNRQSRRWRSSTAGSPSPRNC